MPEEIVDIKGIKNERGLQKFADALPSILVQSDTKKLIKAASSGRSGEYVATLWKFNFKRLRDYNKVLVIFSPIVATATAIVGPGNKNTEAVKKLQYALNSVVDSFRFQNLCVAIGQGDGNRISKILKNFTEYKELLKALLPNIAEGGPASTVLNKIIESAKSITPWVVNGKYIKGKLCPWLDETFGAKVSSNVKKGLYIEPVKVSSDNAPPLGEAPAAPSRKVQDDLAEYEKSSSGSSARAKGYPGSRSKLPPPKFASKESQSRVNHRKLANRVIGFNLSSGGDVQRNEGQNKKQDKEQTNREYFDIPPRDKDFFVDLDP